MQNEPQQREFLVLVTPSRSAIDEFMSHNSGWRVDDVILIRGKHDLHRVRGLELKWENVHFLHRSYEIENAKVEIMARVINYPVKEIDHE